MADFNPFKANTSQYKKQLTKIGTAIGNTKFGQKWKAGEAAIDKKAAPVYSAMDRGIKTANDWQWKHRDQIKGAMRHTVGVAPLGRIIARPLVNANYPTKKPQPPKVSTRKLEYGAASFADDAAMLALRAGDYRQGALVENPIAWRAAGAIMAPASNEIGHDMKREAKRSYRDVKKGFAWLRDNEGKAASLLAAGGMIGAVAAKTIAGHGADLPYSQGGQFRDPYFQTNEVEHMNKDHYLREDDDDDDDDKKPLLKKIGDAAKDAAIPAPLKVAYKGAKTLVKGAALGTAALTGAAIGKSLYNHGIGSAIANITSGDDYTNMKGQLMNETIRAAVDRMAAGEDQAETADLIHQAIGAKVLDNLAAKKQEIAKVFFDTPTNDDNQDA